MTPTIQWTRLESHVPPEYKKPKETYDHEDPLGLENQWDDFYIEDYLGSPGDDHRHFNFDNMPEFHNHYLHDPYATEKRYQPHPEEYFIPIVVDPIPAPQVPKAQIEELERTAPDLGADTPLDLQYYLSGDHKKAHYYEEPKKKSYKPKVVYEDTDLYLEPVYDDLSFLWDHKPSLPAYGHSQYRLATGTTTATSAVTPNPNNPKSLTATELYPVR